MLSKKEDIELSQQLQAGNKQAFVEIFMRYQPLLLDRAYFYLRDVKAAEDVVQDIFLKLWINRKQLHTINALRAYLLKMVTTRSLNRLKRENIERTYLNYASHTGITGSQESPLEDKELGIQIHQAINSIPTDSYRHAFQMLYLQQKKIPEIARETNTNIQVVRNRIHRALKYLRVNLKKNE